MYSTMREDSASTRVCLLHPIRVFVRSLSVSICPRPRGHFGIVRSVRLSVPWRSCLGYRHAGCLQLSHRRPQAMCGLRTRPRTDVDPPRFLPPSNCRQRGAYCLATPGAIPSKITVYSLCPSIHSFYGAYLFRIGVSLR